MRIFLSSTYEDLKEHRKAVEETLARMKAQYSAMEFFGSRPSDAVAASVDELDVCDIFVGFYAWRYGWQPDSDSPSVTEQEFDRAIASNKKCLCYIVDRSYPWQPEFIELVEPGKTRLEQFKRKVSNLVRSKFTTPDDLARQVAADLAREMRPSDSLIRSPVISVDVAEAAFGPVLDARMRSLAAALNNSRGAAILETPHTRFFGRKEWFGCLICDRAIGDYIPFDQDATDIFLLAEKMPPEKIFESFTNRLSRQNLDTFIQLCQSIELLDPWGKFKGAFVESSLAKGRLSAPLRVHFSCTKACNFSCSHCFSHSGKPYAGELTTGEIQRLIDELGALGCLELSIGGGEPFVRADLPDIVRHANNRGVLVSISTNGAAATPEAIEPLKGLTIKMFKVSMEGASDSVYDSVRGEPGSFRKALEGVRNLREAFARVPIVLHRVMMKSNISDLSELPTLAQELKVDGLRLDTVMPVGRAADHPELWLNWEETNRVWDDITAIQKTTALRIEIPHRIPPLEGSMFGGARKSLYGSFGCHCGTEICHVDPMGNVGPSGFLNDTMRGGNLRHQTLKQIWDSGFVQMRSLKGNPNASAAAFTRTAAEVAGHARCLSVEI